MFMPYLRGTPQYLTPPPQRFEGSSLIEGFGLLGSRQRHNHRGSRVSSVFLVVEPSEIIFLYKIRYPKRRIESYSIMGTIVSPDKVLLVSSVVRSARLKKMSGEAAEPIPVLDPVKHLGTPNAISYTTTPETLNPKP